MKHLKKKINWWVMFDVTMLAVAIKLSPSMLDLFNYLCNC